MVIRNMKQAAKGNKWIYPLAAYLVFCSDTLLFLYNRNTLLHTLGTYALVLVGGLSFGWCLLKKRGVFSGQILLLMLSVSWILAAGIVHWEFTGGYLAKIFLYLMGFSIMVMVDADEFMDAYINIITAVCMVSLLGYLFRSSLTQLPLPEITNSTGLRFQYFVLTNIPLTAGINRNWGPYTEPSRYQAYINMALVFLLFTRKEKVDVRRVLLMLLTLLTTFSTTGMVAFAIIFAAFLCSRSVTLSAAQKIAAVLGMGLVLVVLLSCNRSFAESLVKLRMAGASNSFSVRVNSIFGGILTLKEHFWFGTGVGHANQIYAAAMSGFYEMEQLTNTNTMLINLTKFGFIPGAYYLYNLFVSLNKLARSRWIAVILMGGMFVMLGGISFFESLFFNCVVFLHLSDAFQGSNQVVSRSGENGS